MPTAAGPVERLGGIGGAVIANHPPALGAPGVELRNGPAEKADHRWHLLFC